MSIKAKGRPRIQHSHFDFDRPFSSFDLCILFNSKKMKVLFLVPLLVALVSAEGPVAGEENPLELNDIVISSK